MQDPLLGSPEKKQKASCCTSLLRRCNTDARPLSAALLLSNITKLHVGAAISSDIVIMQSAIGSIDQKPVTADDVPSNLRPPKAMPADMPEHDFKHDATILGDDTSQRQISEHMYERLVEMLAKCPDFRIASQPREARHTVHTKSTDPENARRETLALESIDAAKLPAGHSEEAEIKLVNAIHHLVNVLNDKRLRQDLIQDKPINAYNKTYLADLEVVKAVVCLDEDWAWETKWIKCEPLDLPYLTRQGEWPVIGRDVKGDVDARRKNRREGREAEADADPAGEVAEALAFLGLTGLTEVRVPFMHEVPSGTSGAKEIKVLRPDAVCRVVDTLVGIYMQESRVLQGCQFHACIANCHEDHPGCEVTMTPNDIDDILVVQAVMKAHAEVTCLPAFEIVENPQKFVAHHITLKNEACGPELSQTDWLHKLHMETEGEKAGDLRKAVADNKIDRVFTPKNLFVDTRWPWSSMNLCDQSMGRGAEHGAGKPTLQLGAQSYTLSDGSAVQFDIKIPLGQPGRDFEEQGMIALGHCMVTMTHGDALLNVALPCTERELEISGFMCEFGETMMRKIIDNRPLTEMFQDEADFQKFTGNDDEEILYDTSDVHALITSKLNRMDKAVIDGRPGLKIFTRTERGGRGADLMQADVDARTRGVAGLLASLKDHGVAVTFQPPKFCSQLVSHFHCFAVPSEEVGKFIHRAPGKYYANVRQVLDAHASIAR